MHIFDTKLRKLTPETCFKDVTEDGTNTILLIPEQDIDTDILPGPPSEKPRANPEAGPPSEKPRTNPEAGPPEQHSYESEEPL
jgi:hypothetical protein